MTFSRRILQSAQTLASSTAVLAVFAFSSASAQKQPSVFMMKNVAPPSKDAAAHITDFTWQDGSKTVKFSELSKGKPAFINFWATWCPPCRQELPDIVKMSQELKGKVTFVGVSLDQDRTPEKTVKLVSGLAEKVGIVYPVVIDQGDLQRAYRDDLQSIPTTFIVDKNGNIVEKLVGMRSKEEFMQALKKVM